MRLDILKAVDKDGLQEKRPPFLTGTFKRDGDRIFCFQKSCDGCEIFEGCQHEAAEASLSVYPNIRKVFRPHAGKVFVSIDYSGVEVRIAAILSKERVWIEAFLTGKDVHTSTAAAMFNKKPEGVTKQDRKIAKGGTFCALFGGSPPTLARNAGISVKQAEDSFEKFFAGLEYLKAWMTSQKRFAREHQYVKTFFGRVRNLQPYYASGEGKQAAYADRTSLNHPIQGTAADVMKIAMIRVYKAIEKHGLFDDCKMLMTIHDELDFEITETRLNEILPILVDAMMVKVPEWPLPLKVDVEVGPTWGDITDYEFEHQGEPVSVKRMVPAKVEVKPTGVADLHLEHIPFTEELWKKIKKAAVKSPGDKVVKVHTKSGAKLVANLGLVEKEAFLRNLAL